jgi:cytidine deaminase
MKSLSSLFQAAKKVRSKAYAPYSGFKVGAALALEDGRVFLGCNVENASYGATVCAERNAFFAAVAAGGSLKPKALVLVTDPEARPCGICLQVMAEFCSPEMPVYCATPKGLGKGLQLKDLLPNPFDSRNLKRKGKKVR